jgi:hypothetical protein
VVHHYLRTAVPIPQTGSDAFYELVFVKADDGIEAPAAQAGLPLEVSPARRASHALSVACTFSQSEPYIRSRRRSELPLKGPSSRPPANRSARARSASRSARSRLIYAAASSKSASTSAYCMNLVRLSLVTMSSAMSGLLVRVERVVGTCPSRPGQVRQYTALIVPHPRHMADRAQPSGQPLLVSFSVHGADHASSPSIVPLY